MNILLKNISNAIDQCTSRIFWVQGIEVNTFPSLALSPLCLFYRNLLLRKNVLLLVTLRTGNVITFWWLVSHIWPFFRSKGYTFLKTLGIAVLHHLMSDDCFYLVEITVPPFIMVMQEPLTTKQSMTEICGLLLIFDNYT